MKTPHTALLAALGMTILAGCAVGPNYKTPAAPSTAGFVPPGALPETTRSIDAPVGTEQRFVSGLDIPGQWWTLFQSPQINSLIALALKNSPTLEAAQATLREANENVAAQRGSYYPSVSGNYQVEREKSSGAAFGEPGFGSSLYTLNSLSLSVSYTLDAFGGIRRQVEGLQAQADYQRFALEASYLSLTSNIVTVAIAEASLRAQIAATEAIVEFEQQQLDITQRRVKAGGASRADVLQQQSTLQATLASLPPLRTQLAQQRNQLATYVGALPADYAGAAIDLENLTLPADLPVSVPSKFVEQRPDIQQYSAQLHQATAQIGVATANMLPQLTLTGSYGADAGKFSDLFSASSIVYSLAAGIVQPIFKGGTLLHQRRSAIAAAQVAAANYKATVITAFQNVSDALYAVQADADALAAQTVAEQSARESLAIERAQYKSGGVSFLQVLTAEQTYQTAVVNLIKARAQRFSDTAALFQALGGGWWNRNDIAQNSSDCCKESP